MTYAEPTNAVYNYGDGTVLGGAKETCLHCNQAIVYVRPGDWYHIGPPFKAECPQGRLPSTQGEVCQECGSTYENFVYRVPDEVWAIITPKPDQPGAGLLCPLCTAKRAAAAGIYLEWEARRG